MILIADSGGTKSNWRIISGDGSISQAQTLGFNPYHKKIETLQEILTGELIKQLPGPAEQVDQVFFYGAGCSADENIQKIKSTIGSVFQNARVEVDHDLLAAARGLCGNDPGIACILGTGANSCYFDGEKINLNVPSLGFILGDEGGGAYLGKQLLSAFIRNELPEEIMTRFEKRYSLDKDRILAQVYQGEAPARYMASFSKFIFQNIKTPELYHMVYEGLKMFFEKNIMKYPMYQQVPVHFTGSVAFYYSNILRQVASDLQVNVRNITEDPIAGLTLYHQQKAAL